MAMNRYRANEIIDVASKIAVIAMSKQDCSGEDACANMNEATTSENVAGVGHMWMWGYQNGSVQIVGPISEGAYNAVKSIAGNKFVNGLYSDGSISNPTSIYLNFEMY